MHGGIRSTRGYLPVVCVVMLGTLPFLILLWRHPFIGGYPDIVTFARHARTTMDAGMIVATGTHGYFTALQLFPLLFLEGVVASVATTLTPLVVFWTLQHLAAALHVGLVFLIGRRLSGSTTGGLVAAFIGFVVLEAPLLATSGYARFLASFEYSFLFLAAFLAFLTTPVVPGARWRQYALAGTLGAGMLFSHHHFGAIRLFALLLAFVLVVLTSRWTHVDQGWSVSMPTLQSLLVVAAFWVLSNVQYIPFFVDHFLPTVLTFR